MRKIFILLLLTLIVIYPSSSSAQETGWDIESLDSQIDLLENGKVSVNETIIADFKSIEHHGIYRDLTYKKDSTDNKKHFISYEINEVKMDDSAVQYTTSYQDNFFRIKIGNPSQTLTDKHTYAIKYIVTGAIGSFSNQDELFWNITGEYWTIPVLSSRAVVTLPKEGITKITCFQGPPGSTTPCSSSQEGTKIATFQSIQSLNPKEGITLVVGFTKGMVSILEGKAPPAFNLDPLDVLIFSLISLTTFFVMFYLWWKKGRDSWFKRKFLYDPNAIEEVKPIGGHDTIVVEFDPPEKLRPAEMGIILNEDISTTSITATIVDLAVRGYLNITETETGMIIKSKDYELVKQKKDWSDLLPFEHELITRLFDYGDPISISSLKKSFYKDIKVVKDSLNQSMKDKSYFIENPGQVKSLYIGIGSGFFLIPIIVFSFAMQNIFQHAPAVLLALIASGVIVMIFGYFMSARTAMGHEMKNRILGYKLFISTAEKYRQQFFERQNMFNEILPYAILFGQTEKFTKAFSDLGMQPPQTNWYVGAAVFNAATFSNDMSSFAGSFNSSMSSSSGFSGGGGAGGGGGGGGGGGW